MTTGITWDRGIRWKAVIVLLAALTAATAHGAYGQIGELVSPGRLSRAHASLEGITKCLSCHAPGQGVSADRCLACHAPVAARIARRKGVHRDVTTDCVACHVEHAGQDAELRPFEQRDFDHRGVAGFPLEGVHAPPAVACADCHKERSFLAARPSCASCHTDVHKGTLGSRCTRCHTTSVRFRDARASFDHGSTAFPLVGAHAAVQCASCHKSAASTTPTYAVPGYSACSTCHASPHRDRFTAPCASCHTAQSWRTSKVEHARTAFPLRGLHASVACARCHVKPALSVKPPSQTCASCHSDPHRGRFAQDCGACHTESGFAGGRFDHSTTRMPLTDGHAGVACAACHKPAGPDRSQPALRTARAPSAAGTRPAVPVDFAGLSLECVSCHADVHRGELGTTCDTCHTTRTFDVAAFAHARARPFFAGQHAGLACAGCHRGAGSTPVTAHGPTAVAVAARRTLPTLGLARTSDACASCHADVHAGQLGSKCETCHTVAAAKFAAAGFDHRTTGFALEGRHTAVACASCHAVETRAYPAGTATARRFSGVGTACASCHQDPHGGPLAPACDSCHSTGSFKVARYRHRRGEALRSFFAGRHTAARCAACHAPLPARPGRPAVADYRTSTACVTCHDDVHRGALGPDCERCHKP